MHDNQLVWIIIIILVVLVIIWLVNSGECQNCHQSRSVSSSKFRTLLGRQSFDMSYNNRYNVRANDLGLGGQSQIQQYNDLARRQNRRSPINGPNVRGPLGDDVDINGDQSLRLQEVQPRRRVVPIIGPNVRAPFEDNDMNHNQALRLQETQPRRRVVPINGPNVRVPHGSVNGEQSLRLQETQPRRRTAPIDGANVRGPRRGVPIDPIVVRNVHH